MMMVVCYLDTATSSIRPWSATASQHYYGQTLAWPGMVTGGVVGEDVVETEASSGRPVVYVAAGSHATHFRARSYYSYRVPLATGDELDENLTYDENPQPAGMGTTTMIDILTPTSVAPIGYALAPLTNEQLWWQGHWGDFDALYGGPRSPGYRLSGSTLLYSGARDWHNKFIKTGVAGGLDERAEVTIP